MAIEKMKMMNVAFLKKDTHNILEEIVLDGSVHITSSSNEPNFTLRYMKSHIDIFSDMGVDTDKIIAYTGDRVFKKKKYKDELDSIFNFLNIKEDDLDLENLKLLDYTEKLRNLDDLFEKMNEIKVSRESNRYALNKTMILLNAIERFEHSDINLEKFSNLKNIRMDIGEISKSAWIKLKSNYENIKGVVLHLGTDFNGDIVMIFTPKVYEDEIKYLLRSMSFDAVSLPSADFTFKDLIVAKKIELSDLEKERLIIKKEKEKFKNTYMQEILSLYYRYKIIEKIEQIEMHMAMSKNFVMLSGFVPESRCENLKNIIEKVSENVIVSFVEDTRVPEKFKIPTKLKNNCIIRPFEALVKMYSTPNYKETDPTPFFAITYMLLFGMMFGDIGQGLVFFIIGLYLKNKKGVSGIIRILGLVSMIFGFLYGSIFGLEDVVPALLIRPMEDINTILVSSIVIGVIFMSIAYFIGMRNLSMRKEYAKLYFDKNGISGFVFYLGFLLMLVNITVLKNELDTNISSMVTILSVAMMIVTSCLMFMKPKLSEKFENSHKEEFSPVESGFELFETIMGFFSNTLSFIRVGAFAINHVGLFMAFHALGHMIGNSFGNIMMIILGNIVIMSLEVLIVFIQAIRLQYYELFSKYFCGEGINYEPLCLDIKKY